MLQSSVGCGVCVCVCLCWRVPNHASWGYLVECMYVFGDLVTCIFDVSFPRIPLHSPLLFPPTVPSPPALVRILSPPFPFLPLPIASLILIAAKTKQHFNHNGYKSQTKPRKPIVKSPRLPRPALAKLAWQLLRVAGNSKSNNT